MSEEGGGRGVDLDGGEDLQCGDICLCVDSAAEPLDSGGGRRLKHKVKVLLRSQSNFIPPLLVHAGLAYGDTKGRSISIADGAVPGRKSSGISSDMCCKSAESDWASC